MKKLLILFVFILGCKTSQQNYLVDDDYKIIQVLLDRHARVPYSNLKNDSYLNNLEPNSKEYNKKLLDMSLDQVYKDTYYITLNSKLFIIKKNNYIQKLFEENGFTGNYSNLKELMIQQNKIKLHKNIKIIDANNSDLIHSKNYIGDYSISRIIYEGNKAVVIIKNITGYSRAIVFLEKKEGNWIVIDGKPIPYKVGSENIDL